jgi:hypothetical protein
MFDYTDTTCNPNTTYSFSNETQDWPILEVCSLLNHRREKIEQYISRIFQASYGARIFEYLPMLLSLSQNGEASAALGISHASNRQLFCESYLNAPAEEIVRQLHGHNCQRQHIMELGNLASSTPRHSALLYLLAVAAMHQAGIHYLLFAANRKVSASVKRCGFTPISICKAKKEYLGQQGALWGSYYEGDPQVMLADIHLTMDQAIAQPSMLEQLNRYSDAITALAAGYSSTGFRLTRYGWAGGTFTGQNITTSNTGHGVNSKNRA